MVGSSVSVGSVGWGQVLPFASSGVAAHAFCLGDEAKGKT